MTEPEQIAEFRRVMAELCMFAEDSPALRRRPIIGDLLRLVLSEGGHLEEAIYKQYHPTTERNHP